MVERVEIWEGYFSKLQRLISRVGLRPSLRIEAAHVTSQNKDNDSRRKGLGTLWRCQNLNSPKKKRDQGREVAMDRLTSSGQMQVRAQSPLKFPTPKELNTGLLYYCKGTLFGVLIFRGPYYLGGSMFGVP